MRLETLMRREGWTDQRVAEAMGRAGHRKVNAVTIYRLRTHRRTASADFALALERATGGLVRAEDVPITAKTRRILRRLRAGAAQEPKPAA